MPKIRLLAPWTDDKGEPRAAGAVIEVTDEQARELHDRGQASLVEEEEQLAKAAEQGSYSDRATREGTAPLGGGQQAEAPQQPEQPEQAEPKAE
jgi:hypothetical protein